MLTRLRARLTRKCKSMLRPHMTSMQNVLLKTLIIKEDSSEFQNVGWISDYAADLPSEVLASDVEKDRIPIPCRKDREYYHGDYHANWWMSGWRDLAGIRTAAEGLGIDIEKMRYYEMGCASGRVVRHVVNTTQAEIWCSDINVRHIDWILKFMGPRVKAFHSTALPFLPLESNYFDVVSAFSVFTHIDDLEVNWLAELRRILRPGGLAYLTVCTEDTWEEYKRGWIKEHLMPLADLIVDYKIDDALFEGSLPSEKTVFWWPTRDIYNSSVFHSKSYIKNVYGRFFDIVDIIRNGHTYQDVLILKKPV